MQNIIEKMYLKNYVKYILANVFEIQNTKYIKVAC